MSAFEGRKALITGGSSGIGLALSEQLAAAGADVWILARRQGALEEAVASIKAARSRSGSLVESLSVDVREIEAVRVAMSQLVEGWGAPDFLFNSAGVVHPGYAEELDLEIFHWMMDVNYFGTVHVTQSLLPAMLARGSGHIVNLSSAAGFLGLFGYTAYAGSKFAVRGYSSVLRAEMKPRGLRVSIVFPSDTQTPQLEYEAQYKPPELVALTSDSTVMSPEAVAQVILRGVARGKYVIIPGLEGKFYYWLQSLLGTLAHPVMDLYLARARRQVAKARSRGGDS